MLLFDSAPPLCGSIQAEPNYVAQQGDHVSFLTCSPPFAAITPFLRVENMPLIIGPRFVLISASLFSVFLPEVFFILRGNVLCVTEMPQNITSTLISGRGGFEI